VPKNTHSSLSLAKRIAHNSSAMSQVYRGKLLMDLTLCCTTEKHVFPLTTEGRARLGSATFYSKGPRFKTSARWPANLTVCPKTSMKRPGQSFRLGTHCFRPSFLIHCYSLHLSSKSVCVLNSWFTTIHKQLCSWLSCNTETREIRDKTAENLHSRSFRSIPHLWSHFLPPK